MSETLHPIDPVEITLADGKVRQLRFTNLELKRLARQYGSVKKLLDCDVTESISSLIYEGLIDKSEFSSAEEIDALIHPRDLIGLYSLVVAAITGEAPDTVKNVLRRGAMIAMGLPAGIEEKSTSYVNGQSSDISDSPAMTTGPSPEPKPIPS